MSQTFRDRLITSLPADLQAGLAAAIAGYSPDGNDVVEALFAADFELENRNTAALRAEAQTLHQALAASAARDKLFIDLLRNSFKNAEEIDQLTLREIRSLKPTAPWKRAVLGRTATLTTVSVINATLVVAGIQYLRDNDNATFKKHIENPDAWLSYAKNSRDAIDAATQQARAATAVATLIAAPSAQIEQTDGKISITFHESAIRTKHENGAVTITLNDDTERMRAAFGPSYWEAARESRKTIEDDTK